jgi:splicing factor 3A subunit 1
MSTENEPLIVIPPPEMKVVVDKTATYVAQVGTSFEAKLYAKEKNNPKFAFLMPSSHYHSYYKQQVALAKGGAGAGTGEQPPQQQDADLQVRISATSSGNTTR